MVEVNDCECLGGDQQEPEGRQQQQRLGSFWPRRPSKTRGGQNQKIAIIVITNIFVIAIKMRQLLLHRRRRSRCLRVLESVVRFGAPTMREARSGDNKIELILL